MARLFLMNPDVLVLVEPTVAPDPLSERVVRLALADPTVYDRENRDDPGHGARHRPIREGIVCCEVPRRGHASPPASGGGETGTGARAYPPTDRPAVIWR